ncbi:25168_t:CDS:2, partial [Racocetra persica]
DISSTYEEAVRLTAQNVSQTQISQSEIPRIQGQENVDYL